MPEEGYLEELDRPQRTAPIVDRPTGAVVGFAWLTALLIMVAMWPLCFAWRMVSRRRR